jgi:hypothetical protein
MDASPRGDYAFEVKWDGFRAIVSTDDGLRVRHSLSAGASWSSSSATRRRSSTFSCVKADQTVGRRNRNAVDRLPRRPQGSVRRRPHADLRLPALHLTPPGSARNCRQRAASVDRAASQPRRAGAFPKSKRTLESPPSTTSFPPHQLLVVKPGAGPSRARRASGFGGGRLLTRTQVSAGSGRCVNAGYSPTAEAAQSGPQRPVQACLDLTVPISLIRLVLLVRRLRVP